MEELTGKELLKKVKELQETESPARRELARLCGYVKTTKQGEERINVTKFYEALLEAKGLNVGSEKQSTKTRRGRDATFKVTVQKNGQLLIGSAYTKNMNVEPGDEFDIKLGYKHIHLVRRDGNDEEE